MNKYTYAVGACALAFVMSGLSAAVAYAEDTAVGTIEAKAETSVTAVPTAVGAPVPIRVPDEVKEIMRKKAELELLAKKRALLASTTAQVRELKEERRAELASSTGGLGEQEREQLKQKAEQIREEAKQGMEQIREEFKNRLELLREGTTTPARSFEQLKQLIENRRAEIKDGLASTSPSEKKMFEHASQVSVAVHALLASRDLLGGGIGQQVSDIARKVDDSTATTTNAEAKIQSRGFLMKLLFGGDKQSAGAISEQVAENQDRIQTLTGLLADASTTADVKAELEAQMKAIQDEQTRLQEVAQSQKKLWGLFSWRLF